MKSYHSILLFLLVLSYESIQLMDVSSPSYFSKPFFFFLFFFSKPIALHHSCCFLVGLTHFEALECLGKKKKIMTRYSDKSNATEHIFIFVGTQYCFKNRPVGHDVEIHQIFEFVFLNNHWF
jgi:hypothetical protein